jgi:GNAT superfamily N-acetyltransferase
VGEIDLVGGDRLDALKALLARDPMQNMFLLSVLEEYGLGRPDGPPFSFFALSGDRELKQAVLFVGGKGELFVPSGDVSAIGTLGRVVAEQGIPLKSCIGERHCVDSLVRAYGAIKPRIDRIQKLLTVSADDLGPFVAPQLRLAADEDLPELLELTVMAVKETLGVDALAEGRDLLKKRIAARIRFGRTWVMRIENKLCFKIDMGARCRYGAELENMYLLPDFRRRGLATLALGQICRNQLSALPRLTVRFDESNDQIAHTCRKVGFVLVRPQRLWVTA